MPFQVSPGVNVSEIDLTNVTPAVSSTEGAFAGIFRWGPVEQPILVDSESTLVARFGKPTTNNAETFFTAANFLSYGNKLYVARAANTSGANSAQNAMNAVANTAAYATPNAVFNISNRDYWDTKTEANFTAAAANAVLFTAKWPGSLGNSLKVSVCTNANNYSGTFDIAKNPANTAQTVSGYISSNSGILAGTGNNLVAIVVTAGSPTDSYYQVLNLTNTIGTNDVLRVGNSTVGFFTSRIKSGPAITNGAIGTIGNANTTVALYTLDGTYNLASNLTIGTSNTYTRYWEYYNNFDRAPGQSTFQGTFGNNQINDELHVVVIDRLGDFTGVPGTILEAWPALSRATNAKTTDGAINWWKTVINDGSEYIWVVNEMANAPSNNTAINLTASTTTAANSYNFTSGSDGPDESTVTLSDLMRGYDKFASAESVDISLVLTGKARGANTTVPTDLANYVIDNVAESRKDCVVFVSPGANNVIRSSGSEATNLVTFRNALRSSSYAVMDSGYKYQYDKYNDVYRYIPLNGDTAGLCVRTDDTRDPWFSPAGFNRGQIKNIVKLAYNPNKGDRDILYKSGINPVVTFPGQGTILYGDKTLLATASAFDRINVRRLFIILEKAISKAAKSLLFEFNDEFTRAQFKNIVEPFLRDVQGRRGITAFKVICDETNNTQQIIDTNQFVGDIYVKPAKSINFIQLNFVAVRTGVEFSEIVGQF